MTITHKNTILIFTAKKIPNLQKARFYTSIIINSENNFRQQGKLIVAQLVNKLPIFYGTQRFITEFTRAHHQSLSSARSIQSIPSHPISLKLHFNIILPSASSFQSALFPSGFCNKSFVCISHLPMHTTCPTHLILLDLIILTMSYEE
jgi:hypothetical protein